MGVLQAIDLWSHGESEWRARLQGQIDRVACRIAIELHALDIFHRFFGRTEWMKDLPKNPQEGEKLTIKTTFQTELDVSLIGVPLGRSRGDQVVTENNCTFWGSWMLDHDNDEFGPRSWNGANGTELLFSSVAKGLLLVAVFALVDKMTSGFLLFHRRVSQRSQRTAVPYWRAVCFEAGFTSDLQMGSNYHRLDPPQCCTVHDCDRMVKVGIFTFQIFLAFEVMKCLHRGAENMRPDVKFGSWQ